MDASTYTSFSVCCTRACKCCTERGQRFSRGGGKGGEQSKGFKGKTFKSGSGSRHRSGIGDDGEKKGGFSISGLDTKFAKELKYAKDDWGNEERVGVCY